MSTGPLQRFDAEAVRQALAELRDNRETFSERTYTLLAALVEEQGNLLESGGTSRHTEDEMRLVSVMFIDVVDSTEMARTMGAENWRRFIQELHRRHAQAITQWGGEIGQYLGDGLLCYFGARRSRSNDAGRAVGCGLELQRIVQTYLDDLNKDKTERETRIKTSVRIGITTGQVLVGSVGNEEKGDRLAIGDTTNLAARLQNICPPGGILVDTETYRRTRTDFAYRTMPPQLIKGFPEPIANYAVVGEIIRAQGAFTNITIGNVPVPFVGRNTIMHMLTTAILRVSLNNTFESVALYGDSGIGKSRVLQEVGNISAAAHFLQLRAIGQYEHQQTPYGFLREALANLCGISSGEGRNVTEQKIIAYAQANWKDTDTTSETMTAATATIGYLAGYGFEQSAYIQPIHRNRAQQMDAHVMRMVRRWLRSVANDKPLMLLVDNWQWLDDKSRELLRELYQNDGGLFVVIAGRLDGGQPKPLIEGNGHLALTLERLSDDDVRDMVDGITARAGQLPDMVMQPVTQRSQGNPLFVEEFLRMLFDNRVLYQDSNDMWHIDTRKYHAISENLPTGLWGVFQARLDDLTPAARRVVMVASVVGQTFWASSIAVVVNYGVHEAIEELVRKGIITERNESRFPHDDEYTFRNNMYYEVAYNMMTHAVRVAYHRQVAAWILAQLDRTEVSDMLVQLAQHYAQGNLYRESMRAYVVAAQYHLDNGRLQEALHIAEQGQRVGRDLTREEALPPSARLWGLKARAAYLRRHYAEAVANSQATLRLLGELEPSQLVPERVQAAVTLGVSHMSLGAYDEALAALTQAHHDATTYANAVTDSERANVLRSFGQLSWAQGMLQQGNLYIRRSLEAAEASGSQRAITASRSMQGRILVDWGDMAEALRIFESLQGINRTAGDVLYQIIDLRMIATIYESVFAFDHSLKAIEQAEELSSRMNYEAPMLNMKRGLALIGMGRHTEGMAALRKAESYDYVNLYERNLLQLAVIKGLTLSGEFTECYQRAQTFTEEVKTTNPVLYGRGLLWLGIAEHALKTGNAVQTLTWALDNEVTFGGRYVWLCHYALSLYTDAEEKRVYHRRRAEATLEGLAESFSARPELQRIIQMPIAQRYLAKISP